MPGVYRSRHCELQSQLHSIVGDFKARGQHGAVFCAVLVKDGVGVVDVQENFAGVGCFGELLEQAATAAAPTTAVLLERWRDRPEHARLAELAQAEPLVADAAGAIKELSMAVEKLLEESGPGRRMDELLRKAGEMGLNYDEKAELSSLLKDRGRTRPSN